ncbi:MAG: family 16 glycosylhydrolase [Bacteroidales bacterium]|nr:family 16 glycosylhydrolase [Bacteroidales bacterium]
MKNIFLIIFFLFGFFQSKAQTWNLVWSDEFDNANINTSNWTYDIGGTGWGNNELQYYTNNSTNSKTENGKLLIIAKKENYGGKNYTSARLKGKGLQFFTYGKIEACIKLPVGKGIWPAFWMLGNNIDQVGWPACGEIDIMEHINTEQKTYGTMHWDNGGHVSYGGDTACNVTSYHVYSVEWNADAIKWFLDGTKFWQGNIKNNINSTDEFHLPFFIILNMAIGGNWPGNPDGTTPFPDTMFVYYVRVYQESAGIPENPNSTHIYNLQNNPNPFNSSTSFSFNLPTKSFASLKIYDIFGCEAAEVISEELPAGNHIINWNAEKLPPGIYFYKLQTGSYSETKNLVVIK